MSFERQAQFYLGLLKELGGEIGYASQQLEDRLESYRQDPAPPNRVDLEASVAHFEKYMLPLLRLRQRSAPTEQAEPDVVSFALTGHWRAYEFRQLFHGVDYLNKLLTIRLKLRADAPDIRLARQMTRSVIYRQARLYYYLALSEELRVASMSFSSPGAISFEGVAAVVRELRELLDYLLSCRWLKNLVDTYDHLRYERRAKMNEARAREAEAESRLRKAIEELERGPALRQLESTRDALGILRDISDLTIELEQKGFAKLSVVEDNLIRTIANLQRLSTEQQKLMVIGLEERER